MTKARKKRAVRESMKKRKKKKKKERKRVKEKVIAPFSPLYIVLSRLMRLYHPDQLQLLTTYSPGPPAQKRRKTENGANGKKVEDEGEEEKEEPEDDGEGEDEDADDTAETSGPAAAAAKAKGGVVPKESALAEVDDAEEEE